MKIAVLPRVNWRQSRNNRRVHIQNSDKRDADSNA